MAEFKQSHKLHNVLYDIRGPLLEHAQRMEAAGHRILKLNIGNPAPFGFEAPEAILVDMVRHLPKPRGTATPGASFPHAPPSSSTTKAAVSRASTSTTCTWATA